MHILWYILSILVKRWIKCTKRFNIYDIYKKDSIYIDGTIELINNPDLLLDVLGDNEIGFFKHPWCDCIYDEAKVLIDRKHDKKDIIIEQIIKNPPNLIWSLNPTNYVSWKISFYN